MNFKNLVSPKISGKRRALIFGAAAFLSFFSRFAEGARDEISLPINNKYSEIVVSHCPDVLRQLSRKVTKIRGGMRIKFNRNGRPYSIEVTNKSSAPFGRTEESRRLGDVPGSHSFAPVKGEIGLSGETILQLDISNDGENLVVLTYKDNEIALLNFSATPPPRFNSGDVEVPRDQVLPGPVFPLSNKFHFPGVRKGDLFFYSQKHDHLVVGDINSRFFYVLQPHGNIRIARVLFDEVSALPASIDEKIVLGVSMNHLEYRDGKGDIRVAAVDDLRTFLRMAVHLPERNSRAPGMPVWIMDWTPDKGAVTSAQMLAFLGITREEALSMLARDGITRETLERLFGHLYFGAKP